MFRRPRIAPLVGLAIFALAPTARAEKEIFTFDKAHTQFGFKVRHFVSSWNSIVDGNAVLSDDVDLSITVEANKKKPE